MKTIINWFEIPSSDFDRAVSFYNTIMDTKLHTMKTPWWENMAMFSDPNDMETVSWAIYWWKDRKPNSGWVTIYLNANWKIDEILDRIEKAWWKIEMKKTDIWEWWKIALFNDTEWNSIGLHSM